MAHQVRRDASTGHPTLSVIIVNFNSGSYLGPCLASLYAQTCQDFEIIVVDNASTDGSMASLDNYPEVRTECNLTNRGFAAGQNQGIRLSSGRYLMSLNYDLVMETGFLEEIVGAVGSCPEAGWACGKLRQMRADGVTLGTLYAAGHAWAGDRFSFLRGYGEVDEGQYDRQEFVFGAPGAAAVYKREMVEDISYQGQFFDERFFTWYEDVDVDWRAQLRGWRCLYVPTAVAYHVGHPEENYTEPFRSWRATTNIRNRWFMIAANETGASLRQNMSCLVRYEISSLVYALRSGLFKAYLAAACDFGRSMRYLRSKRSWVQSHAVLRCVELQ
jgi:GT2 family glycosyltransferase